MAPGLVINSNSQPVAQTGPRTKNQDLGPGRTDPAGEAPRTALRRVLVFLYDLVFFVRTNENRSYKKNRPAGAPARHLVAYNL